jgi:LmbE family N-acetylglucosaminyl deacetylase
MPKLAKRALVLAPHTDDGELGCGGTIARFISQGVEVFYAAFSWAEKSVPEGMPSDILKKEVKEATTVLGISPSNLILFGLEVRNFPSLRQEILEEMIKLKKELNPDIVFLPSTNDTHQDHKTISEEGFRSFKSRTMLGYEVPWNNLVFTTSCFFGLEEAWLHKKIEALRCYRSQAGKDYASEEFVRSLARTRGTQVGMRYAEAFESIRLVF